VLPDRKHEASKARTAAAAEPTAPDRGAAWGWALAAAVALAVAASAVVLYRFLDQRITAAPAAQALPPGHPAMTGSAADTPEGPPPATEAPGQAAPALPGATADAPTGPAASGRSSLSAEQLQRMVDQVSRQVAADPRDASAWALLAHSQEMLGRYREAAQAYAKLAALRPDDAQVLADYADALAVAQGRRIEGEPAQLIDRALARDPRNLKALALAAPVEPQRRLRRDQREAVAGLARLPVMHARGVIPLPVEVRHVRAERCGGIEARRQQQHRHDTPHLPTP
jgi:tetratricopeptide (TPR) repeat protein